METGLVHVLLFLSISQTEVIPIQVEVLLIKHLIQVQDRIQTITVQTKHLIREIQDITTVVLVHPDLTVNLHDLQVHTVSLHDLQDLTVDLRDLQGLHPELLADLRALQARLVSLRALQVPQGVTRAGEVQEAAGEDHQDRGYYEE